MGTFHGSWLLSVRNVVIHGFSPFPHSPFPIPHSPKNIFTIFANYQNFTIFAYTLIAITP
jgi:hypothetical protein